MSLQDLFRNKRFLVTVGVTILSLLFALLLLDKVFMPLIVNSSKTVKVPSLVGMQRQQAVDMLESSGLKVESVTEQFNTSVNKGEVISQMPYPHALVKEGRRVYLTVSKGYEIITMPNLTMMSQRDAQLALMRLGLQIGTISWDYKDSIPENRVIRQSYLPGMTVAAGNVVNLVLSRDSNATVITPALERLPLDVAMRTLEQSGLQTGEVIQEPNGTYSVGTIFDQSPSAGSRIKPGTKVTLYVVSSD
jgi:serine/threonine-protein kinase